MNRDDVIRMAREAGCALWEDGSVSLALEGFAELVAADERQTIGEDIMAFYRGLVEKGDPARTKVEHCLNLIRLRAKS